MIAVNRWSSEDFCLGVGSW